MSSIPPNSTLDGETISFLHALARLGKPHSILETGGDGGLALSLAQAQAQNGRGMLTALSPDARACRQLNELFAASGLVNAQAKPEESMRFASEYLFDFAVFNARVIDREEEFFYAAHYLKDGALVALLHCHEQSPSLDSLPAKLMALGMLEGQFFPSSAGLYVGRYKKPVAAHKRLVFCLSAGRSGTAYLAALLKGLPELIALHEPEPAYQSHTLALQRTPEHARLFVEKLKRPWVEKLPGRIYLEASHYVAKGFLEAWVEAGRVPDAIVLRRPAREVARSWYAMGADFHAGQFARRHLLHPDDARRIFLPLPGWRAFNNYQLCYWYALENEARTLHYATWLKSLGARVHETSIDRLKDAGLEALLRWLELSPLSNAELAILQARAARKVNEKQHSKNSDRVEALEGMDLDAMETEVRQTLPD